MDDNEKGKAGGDHSRAGGPRPVGEVLRKILGERGLDRELDRQTVLHEWEDLVGEAIARVARPHSAARGVLFVEVRSSAWLMELNMMKGEILDRVNRGREEDRQVRRIVFRLTEEPF